MTSKEAKSILNKYRNRYYNSSDQEEVELAKAIDVIFEHINELDDEVESLESTIEGLHYQSILESE